ncbi:hypothetical protein LT337_09940 [Mycolicibacterium fortuitum]|nr:hypothetical protein LT337_09940 [Mycolicibacterium fortuitum]
MVTTHRMLALYEAKMIHHFDYRWATYDRDGSIRDVTQREKQDPDFVVLPRYWVREEVVADRLDARWDHDWVLGFRDICRSTDERTCIATRFPRAAVSNKLPLVLAGGVSDAESRCLQANLSSLAFDYVARQKQSSTSMNFFILMQLTVLPPSTFRAMRQWSGGVSLDSWITRRVEVIEAFNRTGIYFEARAELDAAFFHLYGIERDDVDYIMETFPIVKRKDIAAHGEYRTKRLILEIYDAMAEAERAGVPYVSPFDEATDS